jgi:hypothetical protein
LAGQKLTLFEYLGAANTLILSFAILRGVSGVPYALRPSSRYGVHFVYLSLALTNCLISFWVFWFLRDVEWTFYRFVVSLLIPILIYVHVSLLVPPDPSTVSSWRAHFFGVRIPVFTSGAAVFVAIAVGHQTLLEIPALHPLELPVYATIAIYSMGLTSVKPKLHTALALGNLVVMAGIVIGMLSQQDPLAPLIP